MSSSRSRSPTRQASQPKTFQPSTSGTSALYGGSPSPPSSLSQLSPGSQATLNQFFSTADQTGISRPVDFASQPLLPAPQSIQPRTFQPPRQTSLSGRRTVACPQNSSPPCFMSPNLSPGTNELLSVFFAGTPGSTQPAIFNSSATSPRSLPRLL